MKLRRKFWLSLLAGAAAVVAATTHASAQEQKLNILVIMGDDIGWMQIWRRFATDMFSEGMRYRGRRRLGIGGCSWWRCRLARC